MSQKKIVLFLLITICISYGTELLPRYVGLFNEDITFHGSIRKFRKDCRHLPKGLMSCSDTFEIPIKAIATENGDPQAIGIGIFISAGEAYCSSDSSRKLKFGDITSPARALELLKTYQTIDLQSLNCSEALIVDIWGPSYYRRSGYIGGPLISGNQDSVAQAQRIVHFFTVEYHYLLAIGLLASLLIIKFLIRPIIAGTSAIGPFEAYSIAWTLFALVKSGLPEMLLPVVSSKMYYVRFSNLVSSIAHLGPAIFALRQNAKLGTIFWKLGRFVLGQGLRSPLIYAMLLISLSPYFAKWLGVMTLLTAGLSLFSGIRAHTSTLIFFGFCCLVETAKLYNLPNVPYGSMTLTFCAFILFDQLAKLIRQGARTADFLMWSKKITRINSAQELDQRIEDFGERYKVSRISIIEPQSGGSCQISIFQSTTGYWKKESFIREEIPPVFSHVLTTRDPVIHVHEDSDFAYHLRKGASGNKKISGTYFSIFPVLKDQSPIAAIAFTSYPEDLMEDSFRKNELLAATTILSASISQFIWTEKLATSDDWYKLCLETSQSVLSTLDSAETKLNLPELLDYCSREIHKKLNVKVFLSRVNSLTKKYDLKITAGYSEAVSEMYQSTDFYALSGNIQGPMPLAINRGKTVSISDLTWLFPVLHPKSRAIFEASLGRSASAVPIFYSVGDGISADSPKQVWGLIWLEHEKIGFFTPDREAGLELISAAVAAGLAKLLFADRAKDALTGLVRPDIAERLLQGLSVREQEDGYLLMVDIRGSTKIANQYGAELWNSFIDDLRPFAEEIAQKYGFQLQLIIWDAIYFTRSSSKPEKAVLDMLPVFASELLAVIRNSMKIKFLAIDLVHHDIPARYCLVFGDITRDIQNGTWTITGTAMASGSKLESACKNLPGWLFTEEPLAAMTMHYELLDARNPGTGNKIAKLSAAPILVPEKLERVEEKKTAA